MRDVPRNLSCASATRTASSAAMSSVRFPSCLESGASTCQIDACESDGEGPEKDCEAKDVGTTKCPSLGLCAPSGCESDTSENDDDCNLVQHDGDDLLTVYGACQDTSTDKITGCFWSEDDCQGASEAFLKPDELLVQPGFEDKLYCDCSDVRVGACVQEDDILSSRCAVGPSSCAGDEVFYDARRVLITPLMTPCRLCSKSDVPSLARTTTVAYMKRQRTTLMYSRSKSKDTVVITAVFGGAIVMLLMFWISWFARRILCAGSTTTKDQLQPEHLEGTMGEPDQDGEAESTLPVDGKEMS